MAGMRPRRGKKPEEEAVFYASMFKDKGGFEEKCINSFKGK
jgi:hypothetical protein